jgi:hypothetical protein
MTARRSAETRFRKWHVNEEATIDHLVRALAFEPQVDDTRVHDAMTHTGLCVEDQVRKAWDIPVIGLAIF